MDKRLTQNFSSEEKEGFQAAWSASSLVRQKLREVLENQLNSSIKRMASKDNYFMPSWSEYQADQLGEQRATRDLIKLLK